MSQTPRTDAKAQFFGFNPDEGEEYVQAHFARELERENAALRASHWEIYAALGTSEADHTKWPQQIAALRAAAVETCALARVWATVWHDKLSTDSLQRFAELEQQILKGAKP